MKPNLRSLLCGAAVAALVIAPTVSGFGQTSVAHVGRGACSTRRAAGAARSARTTDSGRA